MLIERSGDFAEFVGLVLGFRRDADCLRLVWRVQTAPPPAIPAAGRPALAVVPAC